MHNIPPQRTKMSGRKVALIASICSVAIYGFIIFIIAYMVYLSIENTRKSEAEHLRIEEHNKTVFKKYLQEKYAGTYYDGEFVVCGDIIYGSFINNSGTEAYREDLPDLMFEVGTGTEDGKKVFFDNFLSTYISEEGDKLMGETITNIYGKDILYSFTVSYSTDEAEEAILKRNGIEDIISHYIEDGTFPFVTIIVFNKQFDEEQAYSDAVELYDAIVEGKREDKFTFDIVYTAADKPYRGETKSGYSSFADYQVYNDPLNVHAGLYLRHTYDDPHWSEKYETLSDYIKDNFTFYYKEDK